MRRNKYNVSAPMARTIAGIKFDSAAEAHRYLELRELERIGDIEGMVRQPRFRLFESFVHPRHGRLRPIHYVADFMYRDRMTGHLVVEDVKGFRTPMYLLKRGIFLRLHPELDFREVQS